MSQLILVCLFVLMFYYHFVLANSVDIDEMSHNALSGSCDSSLYAKVLVLKSDNGRKPNTIQIHKNIRLSQYLTNGHVSKNSPSKIA